MRASSKLSCRDTTKLLVSLWSEVSKAPPPCRHMANEPVTYREIAREFLGLGCVAFGGPVAHLGHFRERFVNEKAWMDEATFADLIALCQSLPGPSSSQTGFAIGVLQRGWFGGLVAWTCFMAPSMLLMIGLGLGVAALHMDSNLLHGLAVAAVAVVLNALLQMARKLTPDAPRRTIALIAACSVVGLPLVAPGIQTMVTLFVVIAGALVGRWLTLEPPSSGRVACTTVGKGASRTALVTYLLVALVPTAVLFVGWGEGSMLEPLSGMLRSGAFVFGGGHVVLPLLQAEVVEPGWVDPATFLAGYGAAQAVPGPMFTFGAFLGTAIDSSTGWPAGTLALGLLGGLLGLVALNLPGLAAVLACLPWWDDVRHRQGARAALAGINAAVVGLLGGAFVHAVHDGVILGRQSMFEGSAFWLMLGLDVAVVVATTAMLTQQRIKAWAAVVLLGTLGATGSWLL